MVLYKQSFRPDRVCIYFFNLGRAQDANLVLIKVAVTQLFFSQQHVGKRIGQGGHFFLQMKFCSKGTSRLWQSRRQLRATELICQYQANLKNLNYWTRERRKTDFSFSSLMKQVLKFPNKSTMMDDSIKNYARNNPEQVDYSLVSQGDSEKSCSPAQ